MNSLVLCTLISFSSITHAMEKNDMQINLAHQSAITSDKQAIEIPQRLIDTSATIRNMIEDMGTAQEHIPFNFIESATLKKIIRLTKLTDSPRHIQRLLKSLSLIELMHVLNALNYLDCPALLQQGIEVMDSTLDERKYEDSQSLRDDLKALEEGLPDDLKKQIKSALVFDHKNYVINLKGTISGTLRRQPEVSRDGSFMALQWGGAKWYQFGLSPDRYHDWRRPASLFNLRDGKVQEVLKFECSGEIGFSSDGNYLFYAVANSPANSPRHFQAPDRIFRHRPYFREEDDQVEAPPHDHDVVIIELETMKKSVLRTYCWRVCPSIQRSFIPGTTDLRVGDRVYDIKTGTQKGICKPEFRPTITSEGNKKFIKFSEHCLQEIPTGLFPIHLQPDYAYLTSRDQQLTKLFSNGFSKNIRLPRNENALINEVSPSGTSLIRAVNPTDSKEHRQLEVISIADTDNPHVLLVTDMMALHHRLGGFISLITECKYSDRDLLCIVTAEEVVVLNVQTKQVKRIKKPAAHLASTSIVFSDRNDRLIICYDNGSAYLYGNIQGPDSMKSMCLSDNVTSNNVTSNNVNDIVTRDGDRVTNAKFCDPTSNSILLFGSDERFNDKLKVVSVHGEELCTYTFEHLCALIKCRNNPYLLEDDYFQSLYSSFDETGKSLVPQRKAALPIWPADKFNVEELLEVKKRILAEKVPLDRLRILAWMAGRRRLDSLFDDRYYPPVPVIFIDDIDDFES